VYTVFIDTLTPVAVIDVTIYPITNAVISEEEFFAEFGSFYSMNFDLKGIL